MCQRMNSINGSRTSSRTYRFAMEWQENPLDQLEDTLYLYYDTLTAEDVTYLNTCLEYGESADDDMLSVNGGTGNKPTRKQMGVLRRYHVAEDVMDTLTKAQAGELIRKL